MSTEEIAAVVRQYYGLLTGQPHDPASYDVIASDAIFREPGRVLQGRASFRQRVHDFVIAFPDLRCTIEDLVVAGDRAAVRWTITGTHQGAFGPYPATGKQVTLTGMGIHRVVDRQMVEGWGCFDTLNASLQLGAALALPAPAVESAAAQSG